jgi:hypothetical protein
MACAPIFNELYPQLGNHGSRVALDGPAVLQPCQRSKLAGAPKTLLPQHDAAAPILADEVERILADIDPDYGYFAIEFLGHGVLLCLRCPGQRARKGTGDEDAAIEAAAKEFKIAEALRIDSLP